jgi:LacI family transcriptional regulator
MNTKLQDIARETGFSIATVSRVLNNTNYPVKAEVKEKVLEAAQRLGYQPNIMARSLRTDRTNTIGILVDDLMSPFTPPVVRGIQDYLKEHGFLSLIINTDWDQDQEQSSINTLLSRPVDGIIFVEYSHLTSNAVLANSKKPAVFVHRLFGTPVKNSVVPDDYYGAGLAVKHLIGLGHRCIAYINGPASWHSASDRLAGYKDSLTAHGIAINPDWIQPGDWETAGGYQATQNLIHQANCPGAIFAANDLMALGAIYAIQDAGLSVPNDIAVVGYDNREFSWILRPRITTVVMPVYEMGNIAAQILLRQIADGSRDDDEVKVRGNLIIRDSCGADESMKTSASPDKTTSPRRILLQKDPDC